MTHCTFERVLSDFHYNAYEPGEKIPDDDMAAWTAWEAHFFDVEQALVTRQKQAEAEAQGKRKPRSKRNVPVNVKGVRTAAYHHLKALDKMVKIVLGGGLNEISGDQLRRDIDRTGMDRKSSTHITSQS